MRCSAASATALIGALVPTCGQCRRLRDMADGSAGSPTASNDLGTLASASLSRKNCFKAMHPEVNNLLAIWIPPYFAHIARMAKWHQLSATGRYHSPLKQCQG